MCSYCAAAMAPTAALDSTTRAFMSSINHKSLSGFCFIFSLVSSLEKNIDFAEQLESVAYVLCGDGVITFEKFQQIWQAKGIVDKLYRIIDVDSSNQVSTNQIMEFLSNLTNVRPKTGFDKKSLERLEALFRKTVGNGNEIRREDFKKIVISKNVS